MNLPPLSPNILPYDWQQAASDELVSVVSEPIIDHQTVQTEVVTRKIINGKYTGECDRKIIDLRLQ